MKSLFSALAIVAIALALLSPVPTSARTQRYTPLSVSLWCGRDYTSHYCTAYPSGGTGGYTYEWRWYGPGSSNPNGNIITVYPSNCTPGSQYAIVVIVRDSSGASASSYTYLAC